MWWVDQRQKTSAPAMIASIAGSASTGSGFAPVPEASTAVTTTGSARTAPTDTQ